MDKYCSNCGAPLDDGAVACQYCGEKIMNPQQPAQPQMTQQPFQTGYNPGNNANTPPGYYSGVSGQSLAGIIGIDPYWPKKSKITAGVLGILLGTFGIHKFYLGKIGWGILYIVFCGTGIPFVLGIIEGIMYLCMDDTKFQQKYHVRLV